MLGPCPAYCESSISNKYQYKKPRRVAPSASSTPCQKNCDVFASKSTRPYILPFVPLMKEYAFFSNAKSLTKEITENCMLITPQYPFLTKERTAFHL